MRITAFRSTQSVQSIKRFNNPTQQNPISGAVLRSLNGDTVTVSFGSRRALQDVTCEGDKKINDESVITKKLTAKGNLSVSDFSDIDASDDITVKGDLSVSDSTVKTGKSIKLEGDLSADNSTIEGRDIMVKKRAFVTNSKVMASGDFIAEEGVSADLSTIYTRRKFTTNELSATKSNIITWENVSIGRITKFDRSTFYRNSRKREAKATMTIGAIEDSVKKINVVLGEGISRFELHLGDELAALSDPEILKRFKFSRIMEGTQEFLSGTALTDIVKIVRKVM